MKLALLYVSNVDNKAIRSIFMVTHEVSTDFAKICKKKQLGLGPNQTFVLEIWEGGTKLEERRWSSKQRALLLVIEDKSLEPTHWIQKDGESLVIYQKNPLEDNKAPNNRYSIIYAVHDQTIVDSYLYNEDDKRWFNSYSSYKGLK